MRHAFTMVELLMVVAIIAVLVALLLPVIGIMRERGRMAVTEQRMMRLDQAFTQLGLDHGDAAQHLQTSCGLPGVVKLIPKNLAQLSADGNGNVARRNYYYLADNFSAADKAALAPIGTWLVRADFEKPHIFGFPWSEPDRIGMSSDSISSIVITNPGANYTQNDGEVLISITGSGTGATAVIDMEPAGPPRYVGSITLTNGGRGYRTPVTITITPPNPHDPMAATVQATAAAVLGMEDAPQDAAGLQSVSLDQLDPSRSAELIVASGIIDAVDDVAQARELYRTNRSPAQPFNDAWGNPLVVSWGLFQPAGERYLNGATVYFDGKLFADARRAYGYNRAVYLSVAAIGPKLPGSLPAPPVDADPVAWSGTILPALWGDICQTCRAAEWVGASFSNPPWAGLRRERRSGSWSSLLAPRELKSP